MTLMHDDTTDSTHNTVQKTLWSDTLVELLLAALKKGSADPHIVNLLIEMKDRDFEAKYITGKIRKELDEQAVMRVKKLMKKI